MQRRPLDETRTRILDAGVALLEDDECGFHVEQISLIDACRYAGLSTAGSGYKIWPTQGEFRAELLQYALHKRDQIADRVRRLDAINSAVQTDVDFIEQIRVEGRANIEGMVGSPELVRQSALWLAAVRDPTMRDDYRQNQHEYIGALARSYQRLMDVEGRSMRPPFTVEMLAVAIETHTLGLAGFLSFGDDFGLDDIQRPTGEAGAMQSWHLLSCVIHAIVEAFTTSDRTEPRASQA